MISKAHYWLKKYENIVEFHREWSAINVATRSSFLLYSEVRAQRQYYPIVQKISLSYLILCLSEREEMAKKQNWSQLFR